MDRQHAFDALGDMTRRQRCARDDADVGPRLQSIAARLAGELRQPIAVGDLAAIGLAVLQDLDPLHPTIGPKRHGIVDRLVLADYVVDNEEAQQTSVRFGPPDLLAAGADLLAGALLDRGSV